MFGDSICGADKYSGSREEFLQRLFSMFPSGWPGRGLLLLRLVAGTFVIGDAIAGLAGTSSWASVLRHSVGIAAGLLLVTGLWTPVAGALVVIVELYTAVLGTQHLRSSIV